MLKIGNSLEEIAEILELPMETIKAWEQEGDMSWGSSLVVSRNQEGVGSDSSRKDVDG